MEKMRLDVNDLFLYICSHNVGKSKDGKKVLDLFSITQLVQVVFASSIILSLLNKSLKPILISKTKLKI